jgi:hypothetical protein
MASETLTIKRAAEIWNYMVALNERVNSDAIVLCCSYDLGTCDHACELVLSGVADTLLPLTRGRNLLPACAQQRRLRGTNYRRIRGN